MDTYEANLALHYPADRRSYDIPCAILRRLKVGSISLLTNNPVKADDLKVCGGALLFPLPCLPQKNLKTNSTLLLVLAVLLWCCNRSSCRTV